jgi:protein-tyrosine phosphatase
MRRSQKPGVRSQESEVRRDGNIFQVPLQARGVLAITSRPRGGDWLSDDIETLAAQGVQILVSLLTVEEEVELQLENEAALCILNGIEFVALPIPDLGIPSDGAAFIGVIRRLASAVRDGKSVAVHCRQSVGRSGLLAAAVAVALGESLEAAFEVVSAARGVRIPETLEQGHWLRQNYDKLSALGS